MPPRPRKTAAVGSFKITSTGMLAWTICTIVIEGVAAFSTIEAFSMPSHRPVSAFSRTAVAKSWFAKPTLGLLSFDLDDTLFPTGQVVESANQVMIERMHEIGCKDATIPLFLDNTRSIRKGLTEPITYRDLRKKTIRMTLLESTAFQNDEIGKELDLLVEDCYAAWVNERHAAAERFVFDDAVETLQSLRVKYPDACIAAITNGAGNPLVMSKTLAPFFDLRVSGEDDGVFPHRKPHPYIYEYTLKQYASKSGDDAGSVWCHVGDCLANDVGASASCGAQAIWMCTEKEEDSTASRLVDTRRVPVWSTASTHELERRAQQAAKGKESVAAKIERLAELPDAIEKILSSTLARSS